MFIDINDDLMTVVIEQYVGDQCVMREQRTMPQMFVQANFIQLMQEAASYRGQKPIKIRMIRYEDSWDEFRNKFIKLEYTIEYQNWND